MKRFLLGVALIASLTMGPPLAYAAVQDWPVVGQVVRVGQCVVGGAASLVGSLLSHLTAWGTELVQTVGQCALNTTEEASDVAEDVVAVTVPTPDPLPTPETPNE